MVNFTSTSKQVSSNGVKLLVYSPPGMGKTLLTATAPKPLLISAESGLLSLAPKNIERVFGNDPNVCRDIPVIPVTSMMDMIGAYNWVSQNLGKEYFETVCLDSISEIGEILLSSLKATTKDPRQAYGELIEQLSKMLRAFRDLPNVNVYMSAKMDRLKDDSVGTITYNISMPGSRLAQDLPYLFDEVFYLGLVTDQNGKGQRMLHTQPTFQYYAKDRSGALDAMEQPNLTNIINKIRSF